MRTTGPSQDLNLEAYQIAERREAEELRRQQIPVTARFVALVMLTVASSAVIFARITGGESELSAASGIAQRGVQFAFPMYYYYLARSDACDATTRTLWTYALRILGPVAAAVVGLFALVTPGVYLEVLSSSVSYTVTTCGITAQGGYGLFLISFLKNFGCLGFDWLWLYILDVMVLILNIPLTWWVRTRYISRYSNAGQTNYVDAKFVVSQIVLYGFFLLGLSFWKNSFAIHFIPQLLNYFLIYILVSRYHSIKNAQLLIASLQLIAIPISILTAAINPAGIHFINLCFYFLNLFYVQGVIDEVFSDEIPPRTSLLSPVFLTLNTLLFAVGTPQGSSSPFSIFAYPFSTSTFWNVLMLFGGWILLFMARRYLDSMFISCCDPRLYRSRSIILAASAVYFCHGLISQFIAYGANTSSGIGFTDSFVKYFSFCIVLSCAIHLFILMFVIRVTNSRQSLNSAASLGAARKDSLHFEDEMASYYNNF